MIFLWVPETKQRTLEELDYICTLITLSSFIVIDYCFLIVAIPTRTHMSYQLKQTLPFWMKRYVFRNKNAKLEPLYHFDHVQGEDVVAEAASGEKEKEDAYLKEKV